MGNTKQALQLITNDLQDVNWAIDFCKEHNDRELWEDLISYSIDKPSKFSAIVFNKYIIAYIPPERKTTGVGYFCVG